VFAIGHSSNLERGFIINNYWDGWSLAKKLYLKQNQYWDTRKEEFIKPLFLWRMP